MANGFKALRHVGGGDQRLSEYPINATESDMFNGDAVILSAGKIAPAGVGDGNVGTFLGCMYNAPNGSQVFAPYWTPIPGATNIKAIVSGDVGVSYKVETDAPATAGENATLVLASGDPKTGSSRQSVMVGVGTVITVKRPLKDEVDIDGTVRTFAEVTFDSGLGV